MRETISLFFVLSLIWILLSGHTSVLLLSLGLASVLLTLYLAHRMDVIDREGHPVHLNPRILTYYPWLTWETIKSNFAVAKLIVDPRMPISPRIITVEASQPGDLGKTIYANSITLTPGTVSMNIDDNRITVHAISEEAANDLLTGEMDRRVTQIAGDD